MKNKREIIKKLQLLKVKQERRKSIKGENG